MRRRTRALALVTWSVLAVSAATATFAAQAAEASPVRPSAVRTLAPVLQPASSYSTELFRLINHARRLHGRRPLVAATGVRYVARAWSRHLAAADALSHNPALTIALSRHGSANWEACGENVGVGPAGDARVLFEAYMHSPPHRANILDRSFRFVGVAVIYSNGLAWNTIDFVDSYRR
jgi:uncharacterized protein YkwD